MIYSRINIRHFSVIRQPFRACLFPGRTQNVICLGKNYADHIKEMKSSTPQVPCIFLKPVSCIIGDKDLIEIPENEVVHHEVELAVIMGSFVPRGYFETMPEESIDSKIYESCGGYALAIDVTARKAQEIAKSSGLPWTTAKGLDTFLPLSHAVSKSSIKDPSRFELCLSVNGKIRQNDMTNLMINNIPEILKNVSRLMPLQPYDVILTGTPKGVGPIQNGDEIHATLKYENQTIAQLTNKVKSYKI